MYSSSDEQAVKRKVKVIKRGKLGSSLFFFFKQNRVGNVLKFVLYKGIPCKIENMNFC